MIVSEQKVSQRKKAMFSKQDVQLGPRAEVLRRISEEEQGDLDREVTQTNVVKLTAKNLDKFFS